MMFLYPDLVDLSRWGRPSGPDMKPPDGIGGLDPRQHARQKSDGATSNWRHASGRSRELLEGLPQDPRSSQPGPSAPGTGG